MKENMKDISKRKTFLSTWALQTNLFYWFFKNASEQVSLAMVKFLPMFEWAKQILVEGLHTCCMALFGKALGQLFLSHL